MDTEETQITLEDLRDITTSRALIEIFKVFGKYADKLGLDSKSDPVNVNNMLEDMGQDVMFVISEANVADCDMQFLLDSVQGVVQGVFAKFTRHKNELEKELYARAVLSENPTDGKLAKEYSTLNHLFAALNKMRLEQDVDGESRYFYVKK